MAKAKQCRWVEDDNGTYATGCRRYFQITEGTPEENHFRFCCYCGKPLVQVLNKEVERI
ncbi:MAG: hypothetical protein NUV51_03550 [Sulfuricaulis sp.]|nr:hypothetical protein [Sulfuricaulis sp.]